MKEDKLSDLSMQLSVDVLKLTKELKSKHESLTGGLMMKATIVYYSGHHGNTARLVEAIAAEAIRIYCSE
jgi:hypothetical protein